MDQTPRTSATSPRLPGRRGSAARGLSAFIGVCLWLSGYTTGAFAAETKKPNVAALVEGLKSGDKAIRRDASYQLSQLGTEAKAAVPDLVKALDDSEDQVWFNSITALARIGPAAASAVPALLRQLAKVDRSNNHGQRWYRTAFALGSVGPAALPELTKALGSDKAQVRSGAAKAISWMGADAESAVPALAKLIADGDADVRDQAALALGKIGLAALPVLKESLKSDQATVRASAASALDVMGDAAKDADPALATAFKAETDEPTKIRLIQTLSRLEYAPAEFLSLLLPLLKDKNEGVQRAAANAIVLVELPGTTSVPVLKKMVASADAAEAKLAIAMLGAIGPAAGGAVPELIAVRSKPGLAVEPGAVIDETLVQIGSPAVGELVKAMNRAGGDTNHWSVKCLRELGPAAVPMMIKSLESKEANRQRDAIQVLSLIGDSAEPAVPNLKQLAESGPREMRGPALVALASAGAKAGQVLPLAEKALADSTPAMRRSGATALAALGNGARPAVPALIIGLKDKDASVAADCARALGGLGTTAASAVQPLIAALGRSELEVREASVRALGRLGELAKAAVPALMKLLPESKPPLQPAVAVALGAMGANAREALPQLEKGLASEDAGTRAASMTAFARIESDNGRKVAVLKKALDDPAQPVRVTAITELGRLGQAAEPAAEKLYELTEKGTESEQALEVLSGMRIRSVPLLVRALGNPDPYVRQYAVERLGQLGKAAKDAVPEIKKLQEDKEDFVKRSARAAVRDIERAK